MATPINKADAVRNLQRYLRRVSFENESMNPIPIDGIFASRTKEALMEFQRLFGLPVTGIADRTTWNTLFAEYSRLRILDAQEPLPDFFPRVPKNYETQSGEKNAFISLLQFMLNELLTVYDTLPTLSLSGTMDSDTSRSVSEFQRIHLLPTTGLVDRTTWNRIIGEYMQYVPQ